MMKRLPSIPVGYSSFTIFISVYYLAINIPFTSDIMRILSELESYKLGFVLSIPIFLLAAFNFIFSIFSFPKVVKPFFIILILTSSLVSYAGFNYGIIFDRDMIANIIETDTSEASSYVSYYSIVWFVMFGVIPTILVILAKFEKQTILRLLTIKVISMIMSLVVIAIIAAFFYKDYASVGRNNPNLRKVIIPTYYVYSAARHVKRTYFHEPIIYKQLGLDAKQSDKALMMASKKPTLMVLMVGETARAQNYSLNGYDRDTNSYTKNLNIISFADVSSCGTSTAVSVPCMFSNMTKDNFDRQKADHQDNFLDIMTHADISVLWKENDGGDKDVAKNIKKIEIDRSVVNDLCDGSTCYDMSLLEGFEKDVESMTGNRLIALHLIGSHGPTYFKRYPNNRAKFKPDCQRADIENCSQQQIINTYDNTINYTDFVMSETIRNLMSLEDKYNTAMVYISDHGESLGENGMFLHGFPYSMAPEYQTKVPLIVWMSQGFADEKGIDYSCLLDKSRERAKLSHDNMFHSMLGIMDVETTEYVKDMDLFQSCRT